MGVGFQWVVKGRSPGHPLFPFPTLHSRYLRSDSKRRRHKTVHAGTRQSTSTSGTGQNIRPLQTLFFVVGHPKTDPHSSQDGRVSVENTSKGTSQKTHQGLGFSKRS